MATGREARSALNRSTPSAARRTHPTMYPDMWFDLLAIAGGIALLVWGADRFVSAAAALAHDLGMSTLVIGVTVVALGTSAPEILVSATAALQGNPGLAVGNAIGSNIANIGLILGITALTVPLTVKSRTLRREYPLVLGVSLASLLLLWDGELGRSDGLLLLVGLVVISIRMVLVARHEGTGDPLQEEFAGKIPSNMGIGPALMWFVIGLATLLASSKLLVWGAVNVAVAYGVDELVIGLTIVAVGTSLPELAASLAGAFKGEHDLVIGNVLGSNLYNLLAVLSLPGMIAPGTLAAEVVERDLPLMLILTAAIFAVGYGFGNTHGRINRVEGALLLATFIGYQSWLYLTVASGAG